MTISTTSSQAILLGNGATSTFTFSFVCDSASTFQALYTDASGLSTPLTSSQYTLFLNPPAAGSLHSVGGTITYPTSGPPIANGTSLTVKRVLPLAQLDSISNQGDFYPTVTELALDTNVMQIQQVNARTGQLRGIWQTGNLYGYADVVQDSTNGTNTENYYFCTQENTSGVWATDLANGLWSLVIDVQLIASYAASAAASAAAAASSAASASGDAATATTQAGIATTQAGIATAQASAAAASAAAALTSENAAALSESNAAADAASASADAATATTQAAIATAQAAAASASAAAAAASASAALASQTAAAGSASSASTDAGTATTQAAAASSSAAAAAVSEANAATYIAAYSGTSTTSLMIAQGNKVFTTQAGKLFQPGQFFQIASNADAANYMHGYVNTYSGTTLDMTITDVGGVGIHADWNISISGTQGPTGTPVNIDGGVP